LQEETDVEIEIFRSVYITYAKRCILFQDYIDGATVAQLHIKQIRPESFRMYTIVAENSVAIAAKDVQLYQSTSHFCLLI
jgi:hypothetical protein